MQFLIEALVVTTIGGILGVLAGVGADRDRRGPSRSAVPTRKYLVTPFWVGAGAQSCRPRPGSSSASTPPGARRASTPSRPSAASNKRCASALDRGRPRPRRAPAWKGPASRTGSPRPGETMDRGTFPIHRRIDVYVQSGMRQRGPERRGLRGCHHHRSTSAGPHHSHRLCDSGLQRRRCRLIVRRLSRDRVDRCVCQRQAAGVCDDMVPSKFVQAEPQCPISVDADRRPPRRSRLHDDAARTSKGVQQNARPPLPCQVHEQARVDGRETAVLQRPRPTPVSDDSSYDSVAALQQKRTPIRSLIAEHIVWFVVDPGQRDVSPLPPQAGARSRGQFDEIDRSCVSEPVESWPGIVKVRSWELEPNYPARV